MAEKILYVLSVLIAILLTAAELDGEKWIQFLIGISVSIFLLIISDIKFPKDN